MNYWIDLKAVQKDNREEESTWGKWDQTSLRKKNNFSTIQFNNSF